MAFEIRDRHGASRSVAYLLFAASPFLLLTTFVLQIGQPLAITVGTVITSFALGIGAWFSWSRPHLLPNLFYWAAPLIATLVIAGLNLMTNDTSTGSQLFFLWPVLYAANFLSRRVIYLNLLAVSAADGLVVVALKAEKGLADWISLSLALVMTAIVVYTLRRRTDQLRRRLEDQAFADPLTGLANRRAFDDALVQAGRSGRPLALVTIDLDHFKGINDSYGHAAGDAALQLVASAMKEVAEDGDVVARLGGDEFIMLLRCDQPAALAVVARLQAIVAADTTLPSGPPGLSIGVAGLPDHALRVDDLVRASDAALYRAKSGGRGRVAVATTPAPPAAPAPAPAPAARGR